MKKTLLFAAVAIGMAACTNETDVITQEQPREVNFKTAVKNATRAAVTEQYIPTGATIYVSAFQKYDGNYKAFLTNTPFTCADSNNNSNGQGSWTGGAIWPQGTLDLMAYCCGNSDVVLPSTATLSTNTQNDRIGSLSLNFTEKKLEGKTDVMWSEVALDKKGTFSLKFNHALAWVMVNFVKSAESTGNNDDAIKLRNINLHNVYLNGNLKVTPNYDEDNSIISYTKEWTDTANIASDVLFPAFASASGEDNPGMNFTSAADNTSQGLMIIPSKQTSITFEYRTRNGIAAEGATTLPYNEWQTYEIKLNESNSDDVKWEAGKRYTYQISVTTNTIAFTTEVQSWIGTTTIDKELN